MTRWLITAPGPRSAPSRTAPPRPQRPPRDVLLHVLVLTLLVSATVLRFTPQRRPADLAVWTDDVAHCVRMA
jgi:hypothetical protein